MISQIRKPMSSLDVDAMAQNGHLLARKYGVGGVKLCLFKFSDMQFQFLQCGCFYLASVFITVVVDTKVPLAVV